MEVAAPTLMEGAPVALETSAGVTLDTLAGVVGVATAADAGGTVTPYFWRAAGVSISRPVAACAAR